MGRDALVGQDEISLWEIVGANTGDLNGQGFRDIEDLIGGAADDTFFFSGSGSLTGRIDGGPGVNALNYIQYDGLPDVDLVAGTATATAGVSNISSAVTHGSYIVFVGGRLADFQAPFYDYDVVVRSPTGVTGVDDSGVERAARAIGPMALRNAFAVAATPAGLVRLPA